MGSVPSRGNEFTNSAYREAIAAYFGLPSPVCAPFVGQLIGKTKVVMDRYGNNLTCVTLKGDAHRTHHNNVLWAMHEFATGFMGANDIRAEVFGLFAALIAQFDSFMRLARRTRQGLVPDFQVRDQHRHLYLADVKTINVGKTHYKSSDFRVGKRARGVERRANAVNADYHRKARKIDREYNGTPPGEMGPVEARLAEFGKVRGFAFGAFGEASEAVRDFVRTVAEVGAARHWQDMSARSCTEARGLIASEVWRGLGIEVVRSAAELKLSRISVMRGDFTAAEVRRGKGRASWYERRHYRARRDGFARAQHFNQAGARRNHK